MRLLHVIPSLEAGHGGPSKAVVEICRSLRGAGEEVEIAATGGGPASEDVPARLFPRLGPLEYKYSPALARWLEKEVRRYDVVHIHAVFNYSTHAAARAAARHGVPYVIRTLGTLNRSYALRQGRTRKRIYLRLVGLRDLHGAGAIHCTSQAEKEDVESLGLRAPAVVIPLGLRAEEFATLPPRGDFRRRYSLAGEPPLIAFLGRIHPKKGFDILLPALEALSGEHDFLFALAGPAEAAYRASLEEEIARRGLRERVVWTGMLEGEAKRALLAEADIFVLPSYYENFGIAVAEAMACGIPVVVSDQVDLWPEIRAYDAGRVTPCRTGGLAEAIGALLRDKPLRAELGRNGKRLVRERLDWNRVVPELQNLYRSLRDHRPV